MDMPTQYFVFSTGHIYLLFRPWYITTGWQYALSFIGVFLGALLFEFLKTAQVRLSSWEKESRRSLFYDEPQEGEARGLMSAIESAPSSAKKTPPLFLCCFCDTSLALRLTKSVLHAVQVTCSYFLMVVVMTFNAGLLFAIIGGAAVGYFWLAGAQQAGTLDASLSGEEEQAAPSRNSSSVACH